MVETGYFDNTEIVGKNIPFAEGIGVIDNGDPLQKLSLISFVYDFRYFMGIGVGQSLSSNLVCHSTFNALWRYYVTTFMERLDRRENFILVNVRNCFFFFVFVFFLSSGHG